MATTAGDSISPARLGNLPSQVTPCNIGRGNLLATEGDHLISSETWDDVLAAPSTAPTSGVITVRNSSVGGYVRTHIALDAVQLATTDATTSGFSASQAVAVFGKKATVRVVGGQVVLETVATGLGDGTGLENSQNIECGVGTAAAGAGTLSGTEEDVITGDNFQLASYAASDEYLAAEVTAASIDGTSTAPTLYLNFGGADAAHDTANDTITVTGYIVIDWIPYFAEAVNGF